MRVPASRLGIALGLFLAAAACGTNPVTGKKEIQFVSESSELQIGAKEYARLNFAENGTKYIAAGLQFDSRGQIVAVVENRAPFPVSQILLTPVLLDANGRVSEEGRQIRVNRTLQPGERASVNAGVGTVTDDVRQRLRIRVDTVRAE